MAKKVKHGSCEGWFTNNAVQDVLSVSGCLSEFFADYINFWKHNGYWLFDSPEIIQDICREEKIDLSACDFFYYEAYEQEYNTESKIWASFSPEKSFEAHKKIPANKFLLGYDVVSFSQNNIPECSPLSCNNMASELEVNQYCLFSSFEEAKTLLESGRFDHCEPGPYRIIAVYSISESI